MPTVSRRLLLAAAGITVVRGRQAFASELTMTPEQTEGPFYPRTLPVDSDNDLVQVRGSPARAMGTVLHLQGRVLDAAGNPLTGATVEIWQCDSQGLYDHPRQPGRERRDAAFQGYGCVATDAKSHYVFRTLKPVAYPGRAPHIHLKVATANGRQLTSQFYLAGDPLNAGDFVYREATRDPRQRNRVEMHIEPAPGIEAGAFWTSMDIVVG
jgi:protocatechuate 3,4-dioxygenase beta subunit